ncbi:hypothetical protein EDEG_00051 [Edhazardia aedis USNM 41457]|uniref:Elongation of fatty acids protein n=1 Tax=Edhazardia aedis (strain USNM 41457) TaxID=1003232 RepID=J9DVS9_EDHAE|nr:hypothetical protein EDEG_00051 [Edhazardia aedis USNM 41457]|eukprot:EJW05387.1 hypothetical protein EDEG_00051 [Edhazardia aedis USNM 41457]
MNFKEITLDVKTPFITSFLYLIYSIRQNRRLQNVQPLKRELFSFLTVLMVVHNIILCIFSLVTFINTFPVIYKSLMYKPLFYFINDPKKEMLYRLEYWIWIFYVSKIYEVVDSIILHVNKRQTSFLQMYHHAGAIICCWMLCRANTHLAWIFVVLNSFIHTIMYFYYMLTTLRFKPKFKRIITRMQIGQFVIGILLLFVHTSSHHQWSKDKNTRQFQFWTFGLNIFYVATLFLLFRRFEKKTYTKHKKQ